MKILWTPTARKTFFSIIDYLAENWSEKEILSFTGKVDRVLTRIHSFPSTRDSLYSQTERSRSLNSWQL